MSFILAIISGFLTIVGIVTFHSSSEAAIDERDYYPIKTSAALIIIGAFGTAFFVSGFAQAIHTALLASICVIVAHFAIVYANGRVYRFKAGKITKGDSAGDAVEQHRDDEAIAAE